MKETIKMTGDDEGATKMRGDDEGDDQREGR
jgi:hypothetical protein